MGRSTGWERVRHSVPSVRRGTLLRLFVVFQLAATVPVVLVGLLLQARYTEQRTSETLREASVQADLLADLVIGPALATTDLDDADPASVQRELVGLLSDPAVRSQVYRVKVWDLDGRVVASDDADIVGQVFPDDDERARAAAGRTSAEVTSTEDEEEHASERLLGRAVEVYAPLHSTAGDQRVIGVVEIYLPYEGLARDLQRSTRTLARDLVVGLAVIVVSLGAVTWPVLRRLRRQAVAAERSAVTDQLTGLANRAGLLQHLERRDGAGATLVLADLLGLRAVNEALGHAGGDQLLTAVADRMSAAAGRGAARRSVARTDGGEFAVVLPHLSPAALERRLAELRRALSRELQVCGVPVTPMLAVGAALSPDHATTPRELLQRADAALEAARAAPSRTAVYDGGLDPFDADRLRLLTDLRHAVVAGDLRLHLQPQVAAASGRLVGVEALVRWQHPTRGLLGPDAFIPSAERTGLVTEVTAWVLATAAGWAAAQRRAGDGAAAVPVSVNISAVDLAEPGFADRAVTVVLQAGALPEQVCLELTETAIVADAAQARAVLTDLSAAGFRLSLDDFGQGATSLAQLRDLPFDELKLDRAFVAGIEGSAADRTIVTTVAHLAHDLGMTVLAEGVETASQASALHELGYDVLQGWHCGRPVPLERFPGATGRVTADAPPPVLSAPGA